MSTKCMFSAEFTNIRFIKQALKYIICTFICGFYLPLQVSNTRLYLAVFSAVLGNFSFGYSLVYPSPVLPKLKSPDVDPRLRMDNVQAAWFGSIFSLGAAAGGLGAMLLNDLIGRKMSIMLSAVPSTIGWVPEQTTILKKNSERGLLMGSAY